MKLKPGSRLRSQVDATEVIIVRSPAGDVVVACGGHPMIDPQAEPEPGLTAVADLAGGTQIGKRYTVPGQDTFELLVTKPGTSGLTVDGVPAVLKEAKPLPASD
ncbi:MAG: hypothetical protein JWO67_2417 [Streptosporangiaceae bacterium]|jgi:hypothetical protein|nr:hypothetical protein [Streptosporangiaceae bacterium]